MVSGSGHHALYAYPRQRPEKEQSRLWPRAIYLSAGEQQLPLSCRRATELRRVERSQSCPCLYRHCQALWSLPTKSAVHQWTIQISRHSHPRVRPTTRSRVGEHAGVLPGTTTAQKSRGFVCRTQESDRVAPLALTTYDVRSGAVLPGSSCAEHQAIGALPQSTRTPCSARHDLANRDGNSRGQASKAKRSPVQRLFHHPRLLTTVEGAWPSTGESVWKRLKVELLTLRLHSVKDVLDTQLAE